MIWILKENPFQDKLDLIFINLKEIEQLLKS